MRMNRTPSGKSFALFLALAGAATLSVTVAHAGFQWVPPTGAEAPAAMSDGSVPPAQPAPTGDVEQVILPLPGEEQIPAEPQLQPADAMPMNAPRPAPGQTLQLPPGYQAEPLPPPAPAQNQNVLKVKTVSPAPQAPAQAMPAHANEPVSLQPASPPPAPPQQAGWSSTPPAAPVTQTKVIVPQDAPQSAVENTPNSERLVINPYPDSRTPTQPAPAPIAPQAAPVQQPQYSDMAVIEGFGSDMPLALAVQQIVPSDYAYAFEGSVNAGQSVSWDGGKAWDLVINEMLAPLQLEAVIEGKTVHIQPQGLQRQSALAPAQQGTPRRANINDPGEQSQIQDASSLAGIESAAGNAQEEISAAPPAATAVPPAQGETQATQQLPTPAEINGQQQASIDSEMPGEQPSAVPTAEWDAKAGESLKDILTRWSQKAGVELIWMAAYDYKIKNDISLQDSFPNAVQSIVASGIDSEIPPEVEITAKADTQQASSVLIRDKRA